MQDKKLLDICLVEGTDESILASASIGTVGVGDLVELEESAGEIFRVVHMLSYSVEEGDSDYRFLSLAHGAEISEIRRVYRPVWGKEDDDAQ